MGTISSWLKYAIEKGDFESLPEVAPVEERDKLLTLITVYVASDDAAQHPTLARLRATLESWLQHTLDQRVHNGGAQTEEALLRLAAQSSTDFLDWVATSADAQQVLDLAKVERGAETPEDLPISALYRLALTRMLDSNASLEPERLGSRSLLALLPLPVHPDPARVLRGARWRDDVDARYLRDLRMLLTTHELPISETPCPC